jgi:hypothetical protein
VRLGYTNFHERLACRITQFRKGHSYCSEPSRSNRYNEFVDRTTVYD